MKKSQNKPAAVAVGKVQTNRMYTIREACIVTVLGKTCITNLIHKGTIKATRVARRFLIPGYALRKFLDSENYQRSAQKAACYIIKKKLREGGHHE